MDDPIKIIHRFKNNNKRIQYHVYIFVGDTMSNACAHVLEKIKKMDLYTTFVSLEEKENNILIKNYGEYWYQKFFISHHINSTIKTIIKNNQKMSEIKKIYGNEWVESHILNYRKRSKSPLHDYEAHIKDQRQRKTLKRKLIDHRTDEDVLDYRSTKKTLSVTNSGDEESNMSGGTLEAQMPEWKNMLLPEITGVYHQKNIFQQSFTGGADGVDEEDTETADIGGIFVNPDTDEEETNEEKLEVFEQLIEEETQDVTNIFRDLENTDENIKKTTKDIINAVSQKTYDTIHKKVIEFDQAQDMNVSDELLENVFAKNYVKHMYIYSDDTIKTIKQKICCSFKNNAKYGNNAYIIPSYQYLWTEYNFKGSRKHIMLGQKWLIKNDIITLDVVPNANIRMYEDLRGGLRALRDNMKRYGKIKREDDENDIFSDYMDYVTNNEIFMVDIYNELGINYEPNAEELRNVSDTFIKIYFPKLLVDDIQSILEILNEKTSSAKKNQESNKLNTVFENIMNDLIVETEIMKDVELVKKNNAKEYQKMFGENNVIQTVIRTYLVENYASIDLFRIFDNFILDLDYPFVQFQQADSIPKYKYFEDFIYKSEKKENIARWFENAPYGLSFKIKMAENKYLSINVSENGRLDYKMMWKEEDGMILQNINTTYKYAISLVKKINKENEKYNIKFKIPAENDFSFAFVSTNQRFELPNNYTINHNDLSEFCRYCFPYVSLVIDPRKRKSQGKKNSGAEKSKFGTYLRYKRVSKYDNKIKLEHRIIYFLKNYDYNDKSLADEISREFNITEEQAFAEIKNVRDRNPNLKKSRKVLKKLENIPKYKAPGVSVDIQGKSRTKYKVKIAGAKDQYQLEQISTFIKILIYMYVDIYLNKNPDRQKTKEKLKKLTKIAKRRHKVDEIDLHETDTKSIKQITLLDSRRLKGSKKDDEMWPRQCQNSGNDNMRRPQQFLTEDELLRMGYKKVDELNGIKYEHYARTVTIDDEGKKKTVTLRAVKLPLDETGENYVFYTCSPEENGKHMYVGFLSKSKSREEIPRPCCFIKDHFFSRNDEIRNYHLQSIGIFDKASDNKTVGDTMYILQDTNKLQGNRFSFLPKYLDIFFNQMPGNKLNMKNHYLMTTDGYFLKYGVSAEKNKYIETIAVLFDYNAEQIKQKIITSLNNDKGEKIFTSLNNGDIIVRFKTIENYIKYITENEYLGHKYLCDLLSIPGVITKNGINVLMLKKSIKVVHDKFEKEKVIINYHIVCNNQENIDMLKNPQKDTVILVKEKRTIYPIIFLKKYSEAERDIDIQKIFYYGESSDNIIHRFFDYYELNCQQEYHVLVKDDVNGLFNAKETAKILMTLPQEYHPSKQFVDGRFKCRYLALNNKLLLPVYPSGTLYHIDIGHKLDNNILDYDTTFKLLKDVHKISNKILNTAPVGVLFSEKKNKKYNVVAIITGNYEYVPVKEIVLTAEYISKEGLLVQNQPSDDIIDEEIEKSGNKYHIDDRIYYVKKNDYDNEMYNLFRLNLSNFLNEIPEGKTFRSTIDLIVSNTGLNKKQKRFLIKKLLYQSIDKGLHKTYSDAANKYLSVDIINDSGVHIMNNTISKMKINDKWINVTDTNKQIDYPKITLDNNREICSYFGQPQCKNYHYCCWKNNSCLFGLKENLIVRFVNKVTEELIQADANYYEIMHLKGYSVQDIRNKNIYSERVGEKVIVSTGANLEKLFSGIFGKDNIPKIGKRRDLVSFYQDYDALNKENKYKSIPGWYVQNIIDNNNTIFRAFANCYYWLMHPYNDPEYRNIGYYSSLQTELANIYKSQTIDWLMLPENNEHIETIIEWIKYGKFETFVIKLSQEIGTVTNCIVELFVLSKIYETIVFVHNKNYELIMVFHPSDGYIYRNNDIIDAIDVQKYDSYKKTVHIKFNYGTNSNIPERIEVLYKKETK